MDLQQTRDEIIRIAARQEGCAGHESAGVIGRRFWSVALVIEQIISRSARLKIVPRESGKLPRVFEIHDRDARSRL